MKYKALLLDFDGTYIPNKYEGKPSQRVLKAVEKASKIIPVGLATARPYFSVTPLTPVHFFTAPSIINGGARIMDLPSKKVLLEQAITPKDVKTITSVLIQHNVPFFFNDGEKDMKHEDNFMAEKSLLIYSDEVDPETIQTAHDTLSKIPTIAVHKIHAWQKGKERIIISHGLATKQHGVAKVAQILDIKPHEIIAVGDSYIDFPLLMACGLKVAMGNAHPELKEIADYIAPSVDEDGVADVIEKFVLSGV